MLSPINNAFLRLQKRAEGTAPEKLVATFVDVGPLFVLLSNTDHQVLYGRRGTGKTHALVYLSADRQQAGDAVAYVDLRNIGSNAGLYADETIPFAQRATRLLMDTMLALHEHLYAYFVDEAETLDLSQTGPLLDALTDSIMEVHVEGEVEQVTREGIKRGESTKGHTALGVSASPSLQVTTEGGSSRESQSEKQITRRGTETIHVSFGTVNAILRRITQAMQGRRMWVLLDEWSSVPMSMQPYLADFLRRVMLSVPGITVKIGAIEQRSNFRLVKNQGDYIGLELGSDVTADVNLDDYMVFDNDADKATEFFATLLHRHILELDDVDHSQLPAAPGELIRGGFTQVNTFQEYVRAAEGVPRDAINIISLAAQHALDELISKNHVRRAAQRWYERDKRAAVTDRQARDLLHWIIDEVIGNRRARAFLLRTDRREPLIDHLFDARVLHILKRSVSTHDRAGVRYDVYKLDYGCYVDLINTLKAPEGDLNLKTEDGKETYIDTIDVPADDYRAIRRAILEYDDFVRAQQQQRAELNQLVLPVSTPDLPTAE